MRFDVAYLKDEPAQCNARWGLGELRYPRQAFPFYMHQTALSGGIREYIPDRPINISVAVRGNALHPYSKCSEGLQILYDLSFPLLVRQAIEKRWLYVAPSVDNQADLIPEISPVYEQVDRLFSLYGPLRCPFKILIENGLQMPYAISAEGGYLSYRLFPYNPPPEPDIHIVDLHIFPAECE